MHTDHNQSNQTIPFPQSILVTGGAGYIGSHTCLELRLAGYDVIVVDNLVNSSEESLKRVQELTEKELKFYKIEPVSKRFTLFKVKSKIPDFERGKAIRLRRINHRNTLSISRIKI